MVIAFGNNFVVVVVCGNLLVVVVVLSTWAHFVVVKVCFFTNEASSSQLSPYGSSGRFLTDSRKLRGIFFPI
jgi:hypothetical protein